MSEIKEITCINCPLGCSLAVELDKGNIVRVTGFQCPRGEAYAKKEVLNPRRTITTILPVLDGDLPMVSIKTDGDIPKDKIKECILALKGIVLKAPIQEGQIVLEDVCHTGVNFIATKTIDKR
jgi:CxxC motif-containing protein